MTKNTKSKSVKAAAPTAPAKLRKGFAVMPRSRVNAIASMGGKAIVQQRGRAHMAKIGSLGGTNSHRNTNAKG